MNVFELEINEHTITVEVSYYQPEEAGKFWGPWEDCYPDEPADIEWYVLRIEAFDEDGDEYKLTVGEVLDIIDDYSHTIESKLLKIMKSLREEREGKS